MRSTDPNERIAVAVRALADAVPVTPPDPAELLARAAAPRSQPARPPRVGAPRAGWLGPLVTAAAVLALLGGVVVGPGLLTSLEPLPGAVTGRPVLPARPAGLSLLTAPVSTAPAGPAGLSYVQGNTGPRRLRTSQTIVVGIDGKSYRRVDEAERRGGPAEWASWRDAPILLSPDGGRVAVGSVRSVRSLAVVDLRTGKTREYPIEPAGVVQPFAWSPDGTRVAYGTRADGAPPDLGLGVPAAILNLDTGGSTPLPGPVSGAAFSPNGNRLAIQGNISVSDEGPEAGAVHIVDLAGAKQATRVSGKFGLQIAGPNAWLPDGMFIAMVDNAGVGKEQCLVTFLGATDFAIGPPAPIPSPDGEIGVVGWRGSGGLLITPLSALSNRPVYETSYDGEMREVIRMGDGWPAEFGHTYDLQVAAGVLQDAEFRAGGAPDRGPWPWWWRATIGAGLLMVAGLGYLVWRRRTRRVAAQPVRAARSAVSDAT